METFDNFMYKKSLDRLAERCVREKLPIVEFVTWYEKEGIYLEAGFLGNVAGGALAGGGYGSFLGAPGAAVGAGVGALAGAGKYLWDRYKNGNNDYNTTKNQAVEALTKLSNLTPNPKWKRYLGKFVNMLSKINDQQQGQQQQTQQQGQQQQTQQPGVATNYQYTYNGANGTNNVATDYNI